GLGRREDFHATLSACLIDRHEHQELFDQAFALFWRDPDLQGRMMKMLLPQVQAQDPGAAPPPENRRLADALFPGEPPRPPAQEPPERLEIEAALTFSERELLHKADFDSMSADEWQQAKRALRRLAPLFEPLPTRRTRPAPHPGRPDWRATLRAMAR